MLLNTNGLLGLYLKNIDSIPNIDINQILKLESLIENVKSYNNKVNAKGKCLFKVGEHIISGESNSISILLNVREEVKPFYAPPGKRIISKTIKTEGAIKVWFSSGLILTKNTKNSFYSKKNISNKFVIYKENKNDFLPGISALAHIEIFKDVSFNVGGGLNIEGLPLLILGFSHEIKNNLYVNAGYNWAHKETLSDKFSLGIEYETAPEIKTKKILKNDIWFGISYKL